MVFKYLLFFSMMACCHSGEATDGCRSNPCLNGGQCKSRGADVECKCKEGFTGKRCNFTVGGEGCVEGRSCQNGGKCENGSGTSICKCVDGYAGRLCQSKIDTGSEECTGGKPCQNGGKCQTANGTKTCRCFNEHRGKHCEINATPCKSGHFICQNGGTCIDSGQEAKCNCTIGYSGDKCQVRINLCEPNPCLNEGVCQRGTSGVICQCLPGSKGEKCENDSYNDCVDGPCLHGGSCKDEIGQFKCTCPVNWNGIQCEVKDDGFQGGLGGLVVPKMDGAPGICLQRNCSAKGNNGLCDAECNFPECTYDNTECSYGTIPWGNCQEKALNCSKVFKDGYCNPECNNEDCLYDGFDCQNASTSSKCKNTNFCNVHFQDGQCDEICNTESCGWDGLDCHEGEEQIVPGELFIVVLIDPNNFHQIEATFLRDLRHILRAIVVIKKDADGQKMTVLWEEESPDETSLIPARNSTSQKYIKGTKVYLQVDSRNCQDEASSSSGCFSNTTYVAKYVGAALLTKSFGPTVAFAQIGVEPPKTPEDGRRDQTITIVLMAAGGLLFVVAVVGVMSQRKRIRSSIWFPEGFLTQPKSKKADSSVLNGSGGKKMELHLMNSSTGKPSGGTNGVASLSFQPSCRQTPYDDDTPHTKRAKLESQISYTNHHMMSEQTDIGQWSVGHLDAANLMHTSILSQTPPDADDNLQDYNDINVKGPGGYTPLMLACMRTSEQGDGEHCNGGWLSGEEDVDTGNSLPVEAVSNLLMRGAAIDLQADLTGETALHLAARYARADAVKVLLDAGANPNAQDGSGRTPLHAAVAAGAAGVFQILLRNRTTDLNARTRTGATPLILASSLSIENTVEELITSDADIEAADKNGRTALHWAAAVNNTPAVYTLLKNNANKYVQDDKGQTPLFLASKEGAFDTVKLLLDNCAKRNIPDHFDLLPRDIASEKMHHDIVKMLDSYNATSPSGTSLSRDPTSNPLGGEPVGNMKNAKKSKSRKSRNAQSKKEDREIANATHVHENCGVKSKNARKADGDTACSLHQKRKESLHVETSLSTSQSSQPQHSLGVSPPMSTISPTSESAYSHLSSPGSDESYHNDSNRLPCSDIHKMEDSSVNIQHPILLEDCQLMVKPQISPSATSHATFPALVTERAITQRLYQDPQQQQQQQQQLGQQQQLSYMKSPTSQTDLVSTHGPLKMPEKAIHHQINGSVSHDPHPSAHHIATYRSPSYEQELLQHFYSDTSPSQNIASSRFLNFDTFETQQYDQERRLQRSQNYQHQQPQDCELSIEQYLTPSSYPNDLFGESLSQKPKNDNGYIINNTDNNYQLAIPSHHLPTPSPDSSGHWSSSPHSALSDWSDGISSPIHTVPQRSK